MNVERVVFECRMMLPCPLHSPHAPQVLVSGPVVGGIRCCPTPRLGKMRSWVLWPLVLVAREECFRLTVVLAWLALGGRPTQDRLNRRVFKRRLPSRVGEAIGFVSRTTLSNTVAVSYIEG